MILFIFNNCIKFSYTHYCVNQCVSGHAMTTVQNTNRQTNNGRQQIETNL